MTFALPIPKRTKMAVRLTGGFAEPETGEDGVQQRFASVGAGKFVLDVSCPPMTFSEASALVGGLLRARTEQVTLPWPQPGLVVGAPGARTIGALTSSNATVLPVAGGAAYIVRALQYFNVVGPDGRLYLHSTTQANEIPGSLIIAPALRITGTAGLALDFATPKIQGWVQGKETGYSVDVVKHYGVAFSVGEAK